jgi:hypothetical protein
MKLILVVPEHKLGFKEQEHLTHVLHQLQNKPWAALYVACLFLCLFHLVYLYFYGIQQVAQAGWSSVI